MPLRFVKLTVCFKRGDNRAIYVDPQQVRAVGPDEYGVGSFVYFKGVDRVASVEEAPDIVAKILEEFE
jgi:hypothetical protein